MWARAVEFMIGCWLAISPFVFEHTADDVALWAIDLSVATAIMLLATLSYYHPLRHAHLVILPVATLLAAHGRFGAPPPLPPAHQNQIIVGLLLLMFAIVPNWASQPPPGWLPARPAEATRND